MSEEAELIQEQGERILVSVRVRPLNNKERARNGTSDWECINNDTIVFKNTLPERAMYPAAYTFGSKFMEMYSRLMDNFILCTHDKIQRTRPDTGNRVFDCDCPTSQVYEEGAKDVALSVLHGINSSIFAYGQTSSGKTYTMRGITDYAVADIYDYIERHEEREFLVKFSAMEIYNEAVRDLLSSDTTPLRLLDDPERGTVVERLTEETVTDKEHLQELLSICEAQRQIGETALNETSSRSHQILRLTAESSAREYAGAKNSSVLAASVNFIDLAGSERASQTLSAGARLKEGCHINRSLLTLGTVIRKLSKGRNSHVPYRDSKLTRILQNALGGNARTAIICTMSPDRTHVEQSRNTLSFASCAKKVTTNAQVNLVMSDKALVKQLQRELARLENEMKCLGASPLKVDMASLLREKEQLIEQMTKEIEELTRQRDLAQSRVENLLLSVREVQMLTSAEYSSSNSFKVVNAPSTVDYRKHRYTVAPNVPMTNNQYLIPLESYEEEYHPDGITPLLAGPDTSNGFNEVALNVGEEFEDDCKEVRCIEFEDSNIKMNEKADVSSLISEKNEGELSIGSEEQEGKPAMKESIIKEIEADHLSAIPEKEEEKVSLSAPEGIEGKLDMTKPMKEEYELQKTIKCLVSIGDSPSALDRTSYGGTTMSRSRSCRAIITTVPSSPNSENPQHNESIPTSTTVEKDFLQKAIALSRKLSELKGDNRNGEMSRSRSQNSFTCATDLSEGGSETKTQPEAEIDKKLAAETNDKTENSAESNDSVKLHSSWPVEFENLQRKIIELWDACNVPLIHRTYFIMLFKGDPSDSIYMEVEFRRLSFLKSSMPLGSNGFKDCPIDTAASSAKDLGRERKMLCKQIQKMFSKKQKEELYKKWGIGLNTKQRSLQLSHRIWTKTQDMGHVKESAALVAKLLGFAEPGQAPKEVVGLSILPRSVARKSTSWKNVLPPLL
ncbi:Kinesin-like protein NACK1 [Hibiscus syriacus]|uniref:Kinesin-like protein n=1 Tax=Hibiscus syriacus TaxID=106335 RepID=A0A6A2YK08_HIBSY|nr:Kinesin-like protein NACK1 [Hibiscus syriacus]